MTERANPERGEVAILLDGAEYPMRPSYEALQAIEKATGLSMYALALAVNDKRKLLPLQLLAVIVAEGLRAAAADDKNSLGRHYSAEKVGPMIFRDYFGAIGSISDFLANALNGGMAVDRKKNEGETTTPSESTTGS